MNRILEKTFYELEKLMDNYTDLPESRRTFDDIRVFIENEKLCENQEIMYQLMNLIQSNDIEIEKQGFLYGFRFAVSILSDVINFGHDTCTGIRKDIEK